MIVLAANNGIRYQTLLKNSSTEFPFFPAVLSPARL